MKKTRKQNRWLSFVLCLCLLAGVFPLSGIAYAKETGCSHAHNEVCGYTEGTAGQPCAHIHDAACGGLSPDSGLTPCTKAEGCKLLAGHAGVCDALLLPALLAQNDVAANFALSATSTLIVKFDNNNSGGASMNDNDMKAAVEDALLIRGKDKTDFTAIQLTGDAAEITGYNWKYLLELYKTGTGWSSLATMDLSAMASLTKVKNEKFGYASISQLTAVQFPAGLQTIGAYAFHSCSGLQSVTFPAGLQTIEKGAFNSCTGLTAFSVDPNNRCFVSMDGVLYDQSIETLLRYPASKSATSFTVPSTVKTIEEWAFTSCDNLTIVDLSACTGLQSIGANAFYGCSGLQSVTFPAGLQTIKNWAFNRCSGLQSVTLPAGLQTIGTYAFGNCSGLQSVTFPAGLQSIGVRAFNSCDNLTIVDLSACTGLQSIGANAFYDCSGLQSVTLPAGLQTIGEYAFYACSGLTSIAFLGETPPRLENNALARVSANGTLYYPAKAAAAYTGGAFIPNGWAQKLLYTLTVNGGSDETGKRFYVEGAQVQIKAGAAPAGQVFDKWTALGGAFADAASPATTFTMPAADVTVTAAYKNNGDSPPAHSHIFGGWVTDKKPTETAAGSRHRDCTICGYRQTGSIAPAELVYKARTLTDKASGVQVSGLFTGDAALKVKDVSLHAEGDCAVCDDIRRRQDKGELIALFDITLLSGRYKGELDVEIPVGEQYNGQTAVMLHCKDKAAESRTVAVSGGAAKGTFSGLSPFAVAAEAGKAAITGLPESAALTAGESVSWTPAPADGVWRYDTSLLEMTQDGGTYTFKALKEGTATATYTADGAAHTVTVTVTAAVQPSATPQTDNGTPLWPWVLAALVTVALVACLGWLIIKRRKQPH